MTRHGELHACQGVLEELDPPTNATKNHPTQWFSTMKLTIEYLILIILTSLLTNDHY